MIKDFNIACGKVPTNTSFAALKARAFAFKSLAPRAADVLRAQLSPISGSVVTAYVDDGLVGYVALWPIHLQTVHAAQNLVLLGPLMVDPTFQGAGLGAQLMRRVLEFADAQRLPSVLLVGDAAYYQRFGFKSGIASVWQMPGLAAPERLLIRSEGPVPAHGQVLPAFAPPCEKQAAA